MSVNHRCCAVIATCRAERPPDEQAGHEGSRRTAPGAGECVGDHLEEGQYRQRPKHEARAGGACHPHQAGEEVLPGTESAFVDQSGRSNRQACRHGPCPVGIPVVDLQIVDPVEDPQEQECGPDCDQPERKIQDELTGIVETATGGGEDLLVADQCVGCHRRNYRSDHYRIQVADSQVAEDHFHGEEHPRNRCIECSSDACACACGNETPDAVFAETCIARER